MNNDWVFLPQWMVEDIHKMELADAEAGGMRQGLAKGLRHALLLVLEQRFRQISPAIREKIESTDGVFKLEACLRRSVTATCPEDLPLKS